MAVTDETKKNPSWVEPALQGLAFWLGYRKQLFRHHVNHSNCMPLNIY
jgi:hypothetical protein